MGVVTLAISGSFLGVRAARRCGAAALAFGLAVLGVTCVVAEEAQAVTVTPMAEVYHDVVNGDYVLVGNGNMVCDQTKRYYNVTTVYSPACTQFHGGVDSTNGRQNVNDFQWMRFADTDNVASTFNSTSASVTVPAGASVVKAILYWSGNTGVVKGFADVRCSANSMTGMPAYQAAPGTPASQSVSLAVGATRTSVAPQTFSIESDDDLAANGPQYYSASADVTDQLAALPTGPAQTITVGNVWGVQGYGCYAGWSLAVVYDFGAYDPSNPLSAARQVFIYEGHIRKQASDVSPELIDFDGFTVQGPGTRAGFTLYEGDHSIVGDVGSYRTSSNPTYTTIPSAFGNLDNIGTSVADGSMPYTSYTGSIFTNGSVDVRNVALTGVGAGDTSVTLALDTAGDSYLMQNAVLSVPTAAVRIDKSYDGLLDEQTVLAGGEPTFTITVSNAGSTPLTDVAVSDPLAPDCERLIPTLPPPPDPNSRFTYTCTGPAATSGYVNEAAVAAQPPTGTPVTRSDSSTVNVADIEIVKTAATADVPAGSLATWTIQVTNTGSVVLNDVAVTDPLVPACARSNLGTLAAGASTSYTCSAAVSSGFVNTASVSGVSDSGLIPTDSDTEPIAVSRIEVTKTHDLDFAVPGQDFTFTITVRNTGEVPLAPVTVTDPDYPACDNVISGPLAAGATTSYDCTVTAGDEDLTNRVTATGTPPTGPSPVDDDTDVVDVRRPGIVIDKTTSTPIVASGQDATFTITVTNSGQTDLTAVEVRDPIAPDCDRTIGALAIGQSESYTCVLTGVTGKVTNVATALGTPPAGPVVSADDSAVVLTTGVSITKTTATPVVPIGAPATFTITVTNTGEVALTNVAVSDPLLAACDRPNLGPIAAGASAVYTCTDPSVTDGYTNTASVTASASGGPTLTDDDSARVDTAGIAVVKTALDTVVPRGNTGTFQIEVTNTGSVALTPVVVSDPAVPDCDRTFGSLAAGASTTYTCETSALAHGMTNTVSVSGTPPSGPVQHDTDSASIAISDIAITKNVDDVVTAPGDTVVFTITVTNTGEVPLDNVSVDDPPLPACSRANLGTLAPGAATSYTCTVQADQDDITNNAIATGTPPDGPSPTDEDEVLVDVKVPGISIVKVADTPVIRAGEDATFTITVTNTGVIDLENVVVTDANGGACERVFETLAIGEEEQYQCTVPNVEGGFLNTAEVTADPVGGGTPVTDDDSAPVRITSILVDKETSTPVVLAGTAAKYRITVVNTGEVTLSNVTLSDPLIPSCATVIGTLAPGARQIVECESGPLTEGFTNVAIAEGTAPGGVDVAARDDATVRVSDIAVTKQVSDPVAPIGSDVEFTVVVTNTGEVTLTGVALSDPTLPGCTQVVGTLAPGATQEITCTAPMPEGGIENVVSASGTPPSGPKPTDTASASTVPSGIRVLKSADPEFAAPGREITYTIEVINIGQVDLADVEVADNVVPECARTGVDGLGALAAGESTTYQCLTTMPDHDVVNTARATGTPPSGPTPDDRDRAIVDARIPGIVIDKTAIAPIVEINGTATYQIQVTNVGEIDLVDVVVSDPLVAGCDITLPELQIGWSHTYRCVLSPVSNGFTNVATATADPAGGGDSVTDADDADIMVAGLQLAKETTTPVVAPGGTAEFVIRVRNTGQVDLRDVAITDPRAPGCERIIALLPTGTEQSVTCTVTNVTEGFVNTASATGTPPTGDPVGSTDTAEVRVASISVEKTAVQDRISAGSKAKFKITVTNTGEVDLAPVVVSDQTAPDCARTIAVLAAGQKVSYTCELEDLTKTITNIATVTGQASGVSVSDTDRAKVNVSDADPATQGGGGGGGRPAGVGGLPETGAPAYLFGLLLAAGAALLSGTFLVRRGRSRAV